jgi:hypothetical protein
MGSSTKQQREIQEFVRKFQQKGAGKQSAPTGVTGNLYGNTVWSDLFFESSKNNLPVTKASKDKANFPMIFPT